MTDLNLSLIRWLVLGTAIAAILQATVLAHRIHQVDTRFATFSERAGSPMPPLLRSQHTLRITSIVMAILFLSLWWFLGTPAGISWFESIMVSV